MTDDVLKKDVNSRFVSAGVTNDSNQDIKMLKVGADSGGVMSELILPSTIVDGRKTVVAAGTAEKLVATATACRQVTITALLTNNDYVVVGSSTVVAASGTRRGIPLVAGQSITMDIDDVSKIYIDAVVTGEGVSFMYLS